MGITTSSHNRVKVLPNPGNGTFTLHIERRNAWGQIRDRFQVTFTRRALLTALTDAGLVVVETNHR